MNGTNRTLLSYLRSLAAEHPKKPMLGAPGRWLDAQTVLTLTERLGAALRGVGIRSGDPVAFRAERGAASALMLLGLRAAGGLAVLTDPHHEVNEYLSRCGADIPVRAVAEPAGNGVFTVSVDGAEYTLALSALPPAAHPLPEQNAKDAGYVIFTSGSTGKSKAVVLSDYSLVNNLLDAHPLGYYKENDIALGALPLEHVFGLVLLAGTAVLRYGLFFPEKTDIPSLLKAIETERLTRMNGVPSLYMAMAERSEGYDLSSLRAGFIGGGPCTPAQFVYIEKALDMTLIPAYGMSECVGITSASYRDPQEERANSVGRFYARNTGKILLDDGSEAATGQEGEICVDGHALMQVVKDFLVILLDSLDFSVNSLHSHRLPAEETHDLVLDRLLGGLAEMDGNKVSRLPDGLTEHRRRRLLFGGIRAVHGY